LRREILFGNRLKWTAEELLRLVARKEHEQQQAQRVTKIQKIALILSTLNEADSKGKHPMSALARMIRAGISPVTLTVWLWLKFGARPGVLRTYRAADELGAAQHLRVHTSAA
jgi:hypothetical protein